MAEQQRLEQEAREEGNRKAKAKEAAALQADAQAQRKDEAIRRREDQQKSQQVS